MKKEIEKKTISSENRFHTHRAEIRAIGKNKNVDVSTAARMWAYSMALTDFSDELREFEEYIAALQAETTKGNNLVLKYFEGGAAK